LRTLKDVCELKSPRKLLETEEASAMTITLKSESLNLPSEIAEKLKGRDVELVEVEEGFLLKPVEDPIKEARGFLKAKRFSTERYFQMKREEEEIER
jgi:hypothetical protein